MSIQSVQEQALVLAKTACEAGATREAMRILQTGRSDIDADATVDWPMALLQLEALVRSISADARADVKAQLDASLTAAGPGA